MNFAQLRCLCLGIARACNGERVDAHKVEVTITYSDYRDLVREADERFVKLISVDLPKTEFKILGILVRVDYGSA